MLEYKKVYTKKGQVQCVTYQHSPLEIKLMETHAHMVYDWVTKSPKWFYKMWYGILGSTDPRYPLRELNKRLETQGYNWMNETSLTLPIPNPSLISTALASQFGNSTIELNPRLLGTYDQDITDALGIPAFKWYSANVVVDSVHHIHQDNIYKMTGDVKEPAKSEGTPCDDLDNIKVPSVIIKKKSLCKEYQNTEYGKKLMDWGTVNEMNIDHFGYYDTVYSELSKNRRLWEYPTELTGASVNYFFNSVRTEVYL